MITLLAVAGAATTQSSGLAGFEELPIVIGLAGGGVLLLLLGFCLTQIGRPGGAQRREALRHEKCASTIAAARVRVCL